MTNRTTQPTPCRICDKSTYKALIHMSHGIETTCEECGNEEMIFFRVIK